MRKPLAGIKVVELGTHIAVPQSARMMADWGAEVIKVEPPNGEPWRVIGNSYGLPYESTNNPIFQTPNFNKKGIALDLKAPEGQEVMLKLLATADIFITNTRPKALSKLGMDYETLKEKFPKLIYVHFSSYGPKGPEKDRPGFDVAAFWAKSGMPLEWTYKGNPVFKPEAGFGDATVSSLLLAGMLAALIQRDRTGRGEMLQSSLYAAGIWYNSIGLLKGQEQYGHTYPKARTDLTAPYSPPYQTKDGDWLYLSVPNWVEKRDGLLKLLRLERYIGDPRVATLAACRQNLPELLDAFTAAFASLTTREALDGLNALDIVAELCANPKDLALDEQAWANDYLHKVMIENGSEFVVPANPIQFTNMGPAEFKLAPQIGADSVAILTALGYSSQQVEDMLNKKAVIAKL